MAKNLYLSTERRFMHRAAWVNVFFLQWFFLRIAYQERDAVKFVTLSPGRPGRSASKMVTYTERRLGLMIGALPLSGYRYPFRYIGRRPWYIWGKYGERS